MDIYGKLASAYQGARSSFITRRAEATTGFDEAEKPIGRLVNLFERGGGYGAGQNAIIEQEARKGLAAGVSNLVSTGMSSGTNAAGLRARIARDTATAKLGVEDERTRQLANALGLLSQTRGQRTSTLASMQEPDYGSYAGALTSAYATQTGARTASQGQFLDYILGKKRIKSSEKIANMQLNSQPVEKQHFNTPW